MMISRLILSFALAASILPAQMKNCQGIAVDGYKVMLDNLSLLGPQNNNSSLLFRRLKQKISFDIAAIKLETTPRLVTVPCSNRTPEDVTQFTPALIDSLNGNRVLVEIWGLVEAGQSSVQRAQLNYTLVPVSFYDKHEIPVGTFSSDYKRRLEGDPDDIVKLFGEFSDLKAFVSIAAGVKSLKEHSYDQAYLCFCRAKSLLETPLPGMEDATRSSLLNYVDKKVNETFTAVRTDSRVASSLQLEGAQPSCPGAVQ